MSTNTVIREMLITSISCGDADLREILENNIDVIMLMNNACYEEIDYLRSQLGLIDLAMIYSRNKVDEARTRSQSKGFDQYRSKYENESKAQRTAESRGCQFSEATSFQTFKRDSVNRMRSQSDMEANSQGNTQTTRWDRSTQSAEGYSNIADFASSMSKGEGHGSSSDVVTGSGRSYSKTSREFGPSLNDLNTGSWFFNLPSPQDLWDSVKNAVIWDIIGAILEGGGQANFNTGSLNAPNVDSKFFNDSVDDNFDFDGLRVPDVDDHPWLGCCCNLDGNPLTDCPDDPTTPGPDPFLCDYDYIDPLPSYGRGFSVKYNLSIGIPWIGALRVDWGVGAQFRQSHTMTQGCTRSSGEGSTMNRYDQEDRSRSSGTTDIHDEGQTTRDIHTIGDSYRDARSDTTAGSATTGDAHSESHTGSDRVGHAERRAANQGSAWSKGRGRGHSVSTSDSESKTEIRHWSQIFKSLLDMYNRIFDQIKSYESIRALSIGVSIAPINQICCYSLPKDPVVAGDLRRRVDKGILGGYYNTDNCKTCLH